MADPDLDEAAGADHDGSWDDLERMLDDDGAPQALFEGDCGQLALDVRRTFVSLLKKRYISAERHPQDWRVLMENRSLLESRFNDMFLQLVVSADYEVAYKRQASPDGGGVFPTVLYDTVYNREQTILMVHLRAVFRSKRASGEDVVFVDAEDLVQEIAHYRPASNTNHVNDEKAARRAVEALVTSDILLKSSEQDRYRISPIIEVLLPVNRVQELYESLVRSRDGGCLARGDGDPDTEDALS
ncbi:DUF4194 domain-containing protein [Micromonospora sp. CPCC 205371]|nr:DUF4194 domain-containing protein [Micromonospora sp. CPCC 205371]